MSCKELIESLRKAAGDKVKALRSEAEAEADKVRAGLGSRIEQLQRETARKQQLLIGEETVRAASEANRRSRVIGLSAEQKLSERLYEAAVALLPSLRKKGYEKMFAALARELPALAWQEVRVHPEDVARAKKLFPGAAVVPDPKISGGLDASAREGAIRVVNTFEKRLERAWSDLQPELIRDAYREVDGEQPAAATGGPGISDRIPADEDQRQTVASDL